MGAISGVLARVLHALLVVLSIGLIAVFSVASNPSDKNGSESRAMTRVQLFAYNIVLVRKRLYLGLRNLIANCCREIQ